MKNNETYLLSVDASSREIGYCIFNKETKKLIEIDHLTHKKDTSLIERAVAFGELIDSLKKKYNIDEFVIEEAFVALYGTSSSANTTAVLLQINAMYQIIAYFKGLKVNIISVRDSRKYTFPDIQLKKLSSLAKVKEKEFCFILATDSFLNTIALPKKTLTKGPRKGQEVYEDFAYDMVDSFIVGIGFLRKKYGM